MLCAGVAALSVSRTFKAPSGSIGSFSHWPAAGGVALVAAILVWIGRKRTAGVRATLTGIAAGLILGIADAFTRRSVQAIDSHHPLGLLVHWPGYATFAAGVIGLWLTQNAFNAAPLHKSLPGITAAEPAAGLTLGVVVFGDQVHTGLWLVILQLAGVAAMATGVVLVARAPVFQDLSLRKLPQVVRQRLAHSATARTRAGRDLEADARRDTESHDRGSGRMELPGRADRPRGLLAGLTWRPGVRVVAEAGDPASCSTMAGLLRNRRKTSPSGTYRSAAIPPVLAQVAGPVRLQWPAVPTAAVCAAVFPMSPCVTGPAEDWPGQLSRAGPVQCASPSVKE
jgi:hypothetical protein